MLDGLIPFDFTAKEIATQGIGYALFILSLWWILRKETQIKDLLEAHAKALAEKDARFDKEREDRHEELRQLLPLVSANTSALVGVKQSVENQITLVDRLLDRSHE